MDNQASLLMQYVMADAEYHGVRSEIITKGGETVRAIRKDAQKSLKKFSAELGIDFGYLSKIENGIMPLSPEVARRILEAIG